MRRAALALVLLAACNDPAPTVASDGGGVDLVGCPLLATTASPFGAPVLLSDPARVSLAPAIAARGDVALVAWHQFPVGAGDPQVAWRAITGGCSGPVINVPETFALTRWPSVAATATGFALVYEAGDDASLPLVRLLRLAPDGTPVGAPETVSTPGSLSRIPRVAAAGDDIAVVWTDAMHHFLSLRGPHETVTAMPVGAPLAYQALINTARVALASDGTALVAWCDGTADDPSLYDVFVAARPRGGAFADPDNLSSSPNDDSTDVAIAIEPDDTLDVVWAEEDPVDDSVFEIVWSTRTLDGNFTQPLLYGAQRQWAIEPSVAPGLAASWTTGLSPTDPMFYTPGYDSPGARLFPGTLAFQQALARGDDAHHFVVADGNHPTRVLYARGP